VTVAFLTGLAVALVSAAPAADVTREEALAGGVKLAVNMPAGVERASLLVVYATPNGSSAMETLGRRPRSAAEWTYDIQHVLAQVRAYRRLMPGEGVALAVMQAPEKSWPTWRLKTGDSPERMRALIEQLRSRLAPKGTVAMLAHSGGGSVIWALIESGDLPPWIARIGFLDANYSYYRAKHAEPILRWLDGDAQRRLVVVAYDDRFVALDGQPVVGQDGGTQRATARMRSAIDAHRPLTKSQAGECDRWTDAAGQVDVRVDRNYTNAILHTALVGDMNGVLHALTFGTAAPSPFGRPRAYTAFIEPCDTGPALTLPPRPDKAPNGSEFAAAVAGLSANEREAAILDAALAGNVPDFLRQMRRISYTARDADGKDHAVVVWATPDYVSIGSDGDFVRAPMTPATAQRIADATGCMLPTPRLCDEIWRAAERKLQPRPLTAAREAWATFVQHNTIIQEQRRTVPNGPIIAGAKKDIVICRDMPDHPGKVAIYGWHREDGKPIQPVSLVHSARYVDYSHGVRLIWRTAEVDGKAHEIREILRDAKLAYLVSDEGPLSSSARY